MGPVFSLWVSLTGFLYTRSPPLPCEKLPLSQWSQKNNLDHVPSPGPISVARSLEGSDWSVLDTKCSPHPIPKWLGVWKALIGQVWIINKALQLGLGPVLETQGLKIGCHGFAGGSSGTIGQACYKH